MNRQELQWYTNSWADWQTFTSFWHILAYVLVLLPKPTASFNAKELYFVRLLQKNMQTYKAYKILQEKQNNQISHWLWRGAFEITQLNNFD